LVRAHQQFLFSLAAQKQTHTEYRPMLEVKGPAALLAGVIVKDLASALTHIDDLEVAGSPLDSALQNRPSVPCVNGAQHHVPIDDAIESRPCKRRINRPPDFAQ
jgi:hypothetical protein